MRLASCPTPTPAPQVPFYLQRTLGGPDDLRGFRHLRFRDRNALLLQAEYRWEIFTAVDGAHLLRHRQGCVARRGPEPARSGIGLRHRLPVRHGQRRLPPRRGRVRQQRRRALHPQVQQCLLEVAARELRTRDLADRRSSLAFASLMAHARGADAARSSPTIRCRWTTTARSTPARRSRSTAAMPTTSPSRRSSSRAIVATSRAVNVNTIDEVPDSTLVHEPDRPRARCRSTRSSAAPTPATSPNIDDWPIVEGKSSGITPGYRVVDPTGRLYQVKFDPPSNPEMASGAEVIGAAIYHALGYNVVQGYIVEVDPAKIVIAPTATTVDMRGRKRQHDPRRTSTSCWHAAARLPNGKYRATLSRFADGRPLGYFKYYGTRPDDPNDIHPHEHRRELRGSRVFAAWLNHDDSRGLNSLDMLEGPQGRQFIRHYMFDFGSIMGSGSTIAAGAARRQRIHPRMGAGVQDAGDTSASTSGRGFSWTTGKSAKSVGRFEGDFFDPVEVAAGVPEPGVRQPERRRCLLGGATGGEDSPTRRFGPSSAKARIQRTRCRRSHRVDADQAARQGPASLADGVNPLVDPRLDADGMLTFENAAIAAGIAAPSASVHPDVVEIRQRNRRRGRRRSRDARHRAAGVSTGFGPGRRIRPRDSAHEPRRPSGLERSGHLHVSSQRQHVANGGHRPP